MICIYPADAEDFSTNGLGMLQPTECTAYAEDGHFTELELVHPVDDAGRWRMLQLDRIIKAPVPLRDVPIYEGGPEPGETTELWKVVRGASLRLRDQPNTSSKTLAIYGGGTEVIVFEKQDETWFHVKVRKGGRVGWMSSRYLEYVSDWEPIEGASAAAAVETPAPDPSEETIIYKQAENQLWRIYQVEPNSGEGTVTAKARHVFYDLQGNIVAEDWAPERITISSAVHSLWNKLAYEPVHRLIVADGITGKVTGNYGWMNPVQALLEGDEGMIPQAGAQLYVDNWDVYVLQGQARDGGVTIRRGKNLKSVKATEDGMNIVTRIIPVGKNKQNEDLFITDGTGPDHKCVDSPLIATFPFVRYSRIDYDVKVVDSDWDDETTFRNDAAARAKLKELAQADFADNLMDQSKYGLEIDFVMLGNADVDDVYAGMQAVFLNDVVTVIDSTVGVSAKLRVTGFEFDCIRKQYIKLAIGDQDVLDSGIYNYGWISK